jgi:phosphatidate cytidylyltransferase
MLITITTDSYAYIIGRLIGKHKLLETISPNKTWEGMISGTVIGTIIPTVFYVVAVGNNPIKMLFITLFLSILGQFGDLVFSAIKRYFGKKDFSNIMPGHGGILDRLDSIIFVMLGFVFFIPFI